MRALQAALHWSASKECSKTNSRQTKNHFGLFRVLHVIQRTCGHQRRQQNHADKSQSLQRTHQNIHLRNLPARSRMHPIAPF